VERLYFACRVRMNGSDALVLWYQDERDGFVRRPDGQLLVAGSPGSLTSAAAEMGLSLGQEDTAAYDFDQLWEWCRRPSAEGVECPAFLNAWNFFDDLAGLHDNPESEYAKLSRGAARSYDKLFWGNNPPSMTPPGKSFTPKWSEDELESIRRVLEAGLGLVEAALPR
jgi:hypothetical protein